MNRLIQSGLMFGNLIHVASPALVERYNRALKHLTGKTTTQTDFHIDISGFSPEIGDELNDPLYLNHNGVNRQFILLTTQQKTAPLLDAKFSTSRDILQQFIEANESQLFALTAKDAVAGELVNTVFDVRSPERLFDIHTIRIEADTTSGTVRDAEKLGALVDRFKTEPDGWHDDVLIAEMITLAKRTGDVVRNPVRLKQMEFRQENFHTSHFGGMYVFRAVEHPAAICADDLIPGLPIAYSFTLHDRNKVAKFLDLNGLVEPIVKAREIDASAILRQKMDFIVVDIAQEAEIDLKGATRRDIRGLARRYSDRLPPEWHALNQLVQWADGDAKWPRIASDHPAYFYTIRASDTPDASFINMLLSELSPKDIRQLYICHKEAFYAAYRAWSDTKRAYVVDFLTREYVADKAGAREALFGHDAPLEEPATIRDDVIARVGPWGAVRR
ncbi:MAG: DUF6638 family protein [Marivita sp.]|uniref:DUF6638 family protein n=1 Tax=Marivita sp. TaxID=2003365 RepID=UPI003EF1E9C5